MLTPGLAYVTETSGDRPYWDVALEGFRRQVGEQDAAGAPMAEAAPNG
ncbi:MAG TPA: hypothetical protein VIF11_19110 [Methylomirabilota bacterium]|jgi:hypothetical protein